MSRTPAVQLVALVALVLCIRSSLGFIKPGSDCSKYEEEVDGQKRINTWLWKQLDLSRQSTSDNDEDLTKKLANTKRLAMNNKEKLNELLQEAELEKNRMHTLQQLGNAQKKDIEVLQKTCNEKDNNIIELGKHVKTQGHEMQKDRQKIKALEDKCNVQEDKLKAQEGNIKAHEENIKAQEGNIKVQREKIKVHEVTMKEQQEQIESLKKFEVEERKITQFEARIKSLEKERRYKDCGDVHDINPGALSGAYTVYTGGLRVATHVYCDMETQQGGWTTILRRYDGSVQFNLDWNELKSQVGELTGEHWIGLDAIHRITGQGQYELLVQLEGHTEAVFALYDRFWIEGEETKYKLHVSGYNKNSTTGDSFSFHNGKAFSARDADNDAAPKHCAQSFEGAWWYKACHRSNLLATYRYTKANRGVVTTQATSMMWYLFKGPASHGHLHALKAASMKVRRV